MSNKPNRDSALVNSVIALEHFLSEIERVGQKINSTDMTSDFDIDHMQKLMDRFAECGEGVSNEVMNFSAQLLEAQGRAGAVTQKVAAQANLFNQRKLELNAKMEEFRRLGEKVHELNGAIGQMSTAADMAGVDIQLASIIEELQILQQSARILKIRSLEKGAESLVQSLQSVQKRLRSV